MFLFSVLIGMFLGIILKGKINNLGYVRFNDLYIIAVCFGMEVIVKLLINFGIIEIGTHTFVIDVIMYILLSVFVYLNRKDHFVVIMGIGFLLNAIAIFANGGAMPVSKGAMDSIAANVDPSSYGLYATMNRNVHFWYLCDIVYLKFIGPYVFSLGDIVSGIGMILIIVTGMKGKYNQKEAIHHKGRSSRKNRRLRQGRNSKRLISLKEILENN